MHLTSIKEWETQSSTRGSWRPDPKRQCFLSVSTLSMGEAVMLNLCAWYLLLLSLSVVEARPLSVQLLSFLCGFSQELCQIIGYRFLPARLALFSPWCLYFLLLSVQFGNKGKWLVSVAADIGFPKRMDNAKEAGSPTNYLAKFS